MLESHCLALPSFSSLHRIDTFLDCRTQPYQIPRLETAAIASLFRAIRILFLVTLLIPLGSDRYASLDWKHHCYP